MNQTTSVRNTHTHTSESIKLKSQESENSNDLLHTALHDYCHWHPHQQQWLYTTSNAPTNRRKFAPRNTAVAIGECKLKTDNKLNIPSLFLSLLFTGSITHFTPISAMAALPCQTWGCIHVSRIGYPPPTLSSTIQPLGQYPDRRVGDPPLKGNTKSDDNWAQMC